MPTNFQVFDSNKLNLMADNAYLESVWRMNGNQPGIAPGDVYNKLFYQTSIFAAAFAQALSDKGFTVSDDDFAALVAVFANLSLVSGVNWKSGTAYEVGDICEASAVENSHKYMECTVAGTSGTTEPDWPTVGNTQTDGTVTWTVRDKRVATAQFDNSDKLATSKWVRNELLGLGGAAYNNMFGFSTQSSGYLLGYQKLPSGLIIQWGVFEYQVSDGDTGTTCTFPMAFPHTCLSIVGNDRKTSGSGVTAGYSAFGHLSAANCKMWGYTHAGSLTYMSNSFVAIGY